MIDEHYENNTDPTAREMCDWIADDSACIGTDTETERDDAFQKFVKALFRSEEFVAEVLSNDDPAFVPVDRVIERNDLIIVKKDLKRLPLAKHFKSVIELFENYSPEYEYSLNVNLFFKCCFQLDLGREWFSNPLAYTSKPGKLAYELYNDFIELIRTEAKTPEFKRAIYDRNCNYFRSYKSAAKFITRLFSRRLLVLRVDLTYQPNIASSVTAEEARSDLKRFLERFRKNKEFTRDLEGYLWKLEHGPGKGMHFHCFFFYDGSQVQNDEYWANKIGKFWEEDIVANGRGWFFNANIKKHKAGFEKNGLLGIGMIGPIDENPSKDRDKVKRDILLHRVVKYLFRAKQFLMAKKLGGCKDRLWGKGYGPNRKQKIKKQEKKGIDKRLEFNFVPIVNSSAELGATV